MRLAPAEQQVRLDQYGDPLPPGVIARLGSGRLRHGGPIWAVAFAPDSKTLASVSWDCTLRLWDMADGKERLRIWDDVPGQSRHPIGFLNHDCLVSVAFTRDGKTVAAASLNHPIRTWDVATGKWLHRFNVRSQQAIWMALSPDGRVLAHDARSRAIHLAEVATGKELARLSVPAPEDVHCGAFSPDGRIFAGGSEAGIVHLWEVVTGTERPRLVGHQQAVRSLVFLPDSKTLISSGKDNTIRFWEAATGKALRVLTLDERANEAPLLALSREGKMLFTGHRGLVQCWDTTTGKESHRFRAGESQLDYLALSPDGEALAAGGQDDYAVQLWNASTGQPLLRGSSPKSGLCAVVFSQDGRTLATGSGEDARVWDARTGQELHRFPGRGRITLTRDGSTLLTAGRRGDGRVYFWDLKTGQEKSFTQAHQGWVRLVAAAPDGRTFVSLGNQDEMLRLWDLATAREIHHFGGKQASFVTAVAFSPDSKPLATLHQDERVLRLWDVA